MHEAAKLPLWRASRTGGPFSGDHEKHLGMTAFHFKASRIGSPETRALTRPVTPRNNFLSISPLDLGRRRTMNPK